MNMHRYTPGYAEGDKSIIKLAVGDHDIEETKQIKLKSFP